MGFGSMTTGTILSMIAVVVAVVAAFISPLVVEALDNSGIIAATELGADGHHGDDNDNHDTREGVPVGCGDIIMLEDFTNPKHQWNEMNDPVMGGKSTGTFSVDTKGVGIFHGRVELVSFLKAPGFIKAETAPTKGTTWPDVSTCDGLQLVVNSSTPSYAGFRVSFGHKRPPGAFPYSYGFKTDLHLGSTDANADADTDNNNNNNNDTFRQYQLPFDHFTDNWDAGTGDAKVTCAENPEFCPDTASKQDLYSIAVWGEGVLGNVDLQLKSIAAYGCSRGTISSTTTTSDDGPRNNTNDASSSTTTSTTTSTNTDNKVGNNNIITIEDFSNPINSWRTMNDPVMGGQSQSTVTIDQDHGIASFTGSCNIVPFLQAPGFITMTTGIHIRPDGSSSSDSTAAHFPDVSHCQGLTINLRTQVEYDGYYVSFGTDKKPGGHHARGYKTHLDQLPYGLEFGNVELSFSDFSLAWDEGTGRTKVTCQDDPTVCPSVATLQDMQTLSFWGEGISGDVALDIRSIGAFGCSGNGGGDDGGDESSATRGSAGIVTTSNTIVGVVVMNDSVNNSNIMDLDNASNTNHLSWCMMGMMALLCGAIIAMLGVRRVVVPRSGSSIFSNTRKSSSYQEIKQVAVNDYEKTVPVPVPVVGTV